MVSAAGLGREQKTQHQAHQHPEKHDLHAAVHAFRCFLLCASNNNSCKNRLPIHNWI